MRELIDDKEIPSRSGRFRIAIELEESAGELHFQKAMEAETNDKILALFQKLNDEDKDHAKRIREYMKEQGIE